MDVLSIDIETFSGTDLLKSGVYPYAEDTEFSILLFGYAFNTDPVRVVDLASGEQLPDQIYDALEDSRVLKTAYNAAFERICLSRHLRPWALTGGEYLKPEQWACTMVQALTLGLPGNLAGVAKVLFRGEQEKQKMSDGKALIRYFCNPCRPTMTNGGRTRNCPENAPEKWATFKDYCCQDVEVERAIRMKIAHYPMVDSERRLWVLDQQINDRGMRVDLPLVRQAVLCNEEDKARAMDEAVKLTGLENPGSVAQLKEWLFAETSEVVTSLNKETIPTLLKATENAMVRRVLELRQELSKTSVKKYTAMENAVCTDSRVRGLLQFYGANRTGRWAGRLVQVQNLPKNKYKDLDLARRLLSGGRFEMIDILFGGVQNVLSQLIRTAFIPADGCCFLVADFSAIEARVIAWLASEVWRLDVFAGHGKIYEASASQMFKVPIESITKASPLRQKGKVAELALGYQGGPNALIKMGALDMGLTEKELPGLVSAWREANPNIVQLWYDAERAAIKAVREKTTVKLRRGVSFTYERGMLFANLPSGRSLAYVRPKMEQHPHLDKQSLTYEGMDQTTKQWRHIPTYGGKIVENLVQAIARDCLAAAMIRLDQNGYAIGMHIHDEAVIEIPDTGLSAFELEKACAIMGQPISWAPGLPLRADGFVCHYYKKDD
ncbi:MAG: DNA polymerase [Negativicutes bacterium]|nr:DNA polymerase [Negativicutes bacterium]